MPSHRSPGFRNVKITAPRYVFVWRSPDSVYRLGGSRRDELMPQFEAHGEDAHLVESADISEIGDLRLAFADGCVLDAFADIGFVETEGEEAPWECWRLFQPAKDRPHLVVWAGGVIDYPTEVDG